MGASHGPLLEKGDWERDGLQAFVPESKTAWEACWLPMQEIGRDAYGVMHFSEVKKWGRILA